MAGTKCQAYRKVVEVTLNSSKIEGLQRQEKADCWYWELMGVGLALRNPRNQLKRFGCGGRI